MKKTCLNKFEWRLAGKRAGVVWCKHRHSIQKGPFHMYIYIFMYMILKL